MVPLGGLAAGQDAGSGDLPGQGVILSYNGSNNLGEKIVGVNYTIKQTPGSDKITGIYRIVGDNSSIFTISTDRIPKLTIDTKDTGFTLKKGSTYMIETQYYYDTNGNNIYDENIDKFLEDQTTGDTTFTTFLNL